VDSANRVLLRDRSATPTAEVGDVGICHQLEGEPVRVPEGEYLSSKRAVGRRRCNTALETLAGLATRLARLMR
jgi:hypothetical protein